jgi:hypothetical protein
MRGSVRGGWKRAAVYLAGRLLYRKHGSGEGRWKSVAQPNGAQ